MRAMTIQIYRQRLQAPLQLQLHRRLQLMSLLPLRQQQRVVPAAAAAALPW